MTAVEVVAPVLEQIIEEGIESLDEGWISSRTCILSTSKMQIQILVTRDRDERMTAPNDGRVAVKLHRGGPA